MLVVGVCDADPRGGGWASDFEAGEGHGLGPMRLHGDMGMGYLGLGRAGRHTGD